MLAFYDSDQSDSSKYLERIYTFSLLFAILVVTTDVGQKNDNKVSL